MTHAPESGNRFAAGTFTRPSAPASVARMTAAQTRMELALFLRNGEQLLVALVIPVAILFLGIDNEMKIFVVFLACIFPILLNTYSGVRSVDPVLIDTGRTFGVSWLRALWSIVLPASLPSILTGMRISIGIAWLVIVAAEMLVGGTGIGYFVWNEWNNLSITNVINAILLIGLVGMVLDQILAFAGRMVTFPE